MDGVTVVGHPLVQHKLTLIRDKTISTKSFRELLKEIGMLLCYEVTRDLPLAKILEGGTWAAGRAMAFARRPDGSPPVRIISDGTVF